MALKGTLKDFGIADILQLIGHQTKTGVLHLVAKDEEVHVAFSNGSIVRADSASRKQRDRLGEMLVHAGILTRDQLDEALEIQKRTLQRLGDLLVGKHFVAVEQLKEMVQLQVSETIYRLFGWKSGTYEFEQGAVEFDPAMVTPLRSESVLMEGFRRVDEWPKIRAVIGSPAMTFVRLAELPPEVAKAPGGGKDDVDVDIDAAFGEEKRAGKGEFSTLGRNEARVFALAEPGRTVQEIIDRSRLGEFETCKALCNLVGGGKLQAIAPARAARGERLGPLGRSLRERIGSGLTRLGMTAVVGAAVLGLSYLLDAQQVAESSGEAPFADRTIAHVVGDGQLARIHVALAVHRLEQGRYPDRLEELQTEGLLTARDLRYPYRSRYYYRRDGGGYVLLPPIE